MANPFILALQKRLDKGEISQEQYNQLAELFKEPEPEPVEGVTAPTLEERVDSLENTLLTLLFM
jgi:cell shape-determining protein MreC